jgi:AAA-like domain
MTNYEYQVGGSLTCDAPSYLVRQADLELHTALDRGDFCYIFNSRQMGKSSLRVRTMSRLQTAGSRCGVIDMTLIGTQTTTPEQWYASIAALLASNFHLTVNIGEWWRQHDYLSLPGRLGLFIESILLGQVAERVTIFIDELDSVLGLKFPVDDFFALIRYCYERRADHPAYQRLTWALFGVATPSDLISDPKRTPFNVGKAIELRGFQEHEALPLAAGLVGSINSPPAVLRAILNWTGGQPFLTQKLCQLALQACQATRQSQLTLPPGTEAFWVEQLVSQDEPEHLRTIRDRLLRDEHQAGPLLRLYYTILWQDQTAPAALADGPSSQVALANCSADSDHPNDSSAQLALILSGLVEKKSSLLQIKNPIYREIFNLVWVDKQLRNLRPYASAIEAWVASHKTDESRLLRGTALQTALAWSQHKPISLADQEFLTASQALDRRQHEQSQQIEQLQVHTLQLKDQLDQLAQQLRRSQQQRLWLIIVIGGLGLILLLTLVRIFSS